MSNATSSISSRVEPEGGMHSGTVGTSDKQCGYDWPGSVPWQGNVSFYAIFSGLNTALFYQVVLDENSAILCLAVYKEFFKFC